MKLEQKPAVFQPITITLETLEEAQQFWALCNHMEIINVVGLVGKLNEALESTKIKDYRSFWETTLHEYTFKKQT